VLAHNSSMCFGEAPNNDLKKLRGLDRAPTAEEAAQPPDKRPWTEYDMEGNKQGRPPFKACHPHACICCGPVWCVFECQWCKACGHDADRTCDVCCRCQTNRMKMFVCCGPQKDDPVKWCDCCLCCCGPKDGDADMRVSRQEACECDCVSNRFIPRYGGCQFCCIHITCVKCGGCCPADCQNKCCCEEEMLMMDGDLVPFTKEVKMLLHPENQAMERDGATASAENEPRL